MMRKRVYGKTPELSIEQLKDIFHDKRLKYIEAAFLFGSRASKGFSLQSDYDFAVLPTQNVEAPWGMSAKLWDDITQVSGLAEYDLDIVNLHSVTENMKKSIQENFVVLKGDEDALWRILTRE